MRVNLYFSKRKLVLRYLFKWIFNSVVASGRLAPIFFNGNASVSDAKRNQTLLPNTLMLRRKFSICNFITIGIVAELQLPTGVSRPQRILRKAMKITVHDC